MGNIGIFDSGIGGATVFKEILKKIPNENYIYYSDSINNPYGDKTKDEIIRISENVVQNLIKQNCKIIVVACNTASAKAADELRKKHKNIPIVAIEPAYKMVYDFAYDKPTLILATKGTIESKKFKDLYNKYNNKKTFILACVGLAELIEENNEQKIWKYLEKNIAPFKGKVDNVVLGCTHYPIIQEKLAQTLGNVEFFNRSRKSCKQLKTCFRK